MTAPLQTAALSQEMPPRKMQRSAVRECVAQSTGFDRVEGEVDGQVSRASDFRLGGKLIERTYDRSTHETLDDISSEDLAHRLVNAPYETNYILVILMLPSGC